MPRTGARAEALSTLLTAAGFQPAGKPAAPRIRTEALGAPLPATRRDPRIPNPTARQLGPRRHS